MIGSQRRAFEKGLILSQRHILISSLVVRCQQVFLKVIHESKDCECCTRKFFYAFRYISKRPLFRCLWANQAMLYCKAVDKIALEFVGFPSALITLHTFKFKSLTFRSDPLRALLKYCMILECIDKK